MSKYFETIINNLNNTIERRTRLNEDQLGNEAIYNNNNQLLSKNSDDFVDDGDYISEKISAKLEIVMCGGGHIGLSIYNLAQLLEWKVTIIEDRAEFCTSKRYPNARLLLGNYVDEIKKLDLSNSAIIIATRGHKHDKSCLEAALLKKKYRYLGMIGSKGKVADTKKLIIDEIENNDVDITEADLNAIYSPIGLNINAQTPQEIAISIVSQIIKVIKNEKKQIELDYNLLKRLSTEKNSFVVARIVEKKGSAPREQGSFLAVFDNGDIEGTIGGGSVESQVIKDSLSLLKSKDKKSQLYYHNLSNTKASKLGMICGGDVKVLLTKFNS